MKNSQINRLLKHLKTGGTVTCLQAYQDHGIMQLARRINDIEEMGYVIKRAWIKVYNRFGEECRVKEYSLAADLMAAA